MQIIQAVRPGAGIAEVLRSALSAWFTEYAELFSAVTSLSETSPSLMAAFLLRFAEWERRLAEALRARYPGLGAENALIWAMIAFGLLRLAPPFASLRGSSFADAANEVFDRFETLAMAGHEPGIDPAQR